MQPTCNFAFKEWAAVCEALAAGRQTIILRKGGIHEEIQGFRIAAHRGFWLYPTNFHQLAEDLTSDAGEYINRAATAVPPPGQIRLRLFAELHWLTELTTEQAALRLADLHVWSEATVRRRFAYRHPLLFLLGVRVYSLKEHVLVPESAQLAGCKSWVTLPEPISTEGLQPVVSESEWFAMSKAVHSALA